MIPLTWLKGEMCVQFVKKSAFYNNKLIARVPNISSKSHRFKQKTQIQFKTFCFSMSDLC